MGMFTETPLFDDPSLPTGWYRKVVQRQTGATAGQWDVYVYNPDGKKFRSRNELRAYFNQIGSNLNSEDFDFSVKGKGHHNKGKSPTKKSEAESSKENQVSKKSTTPVVNKRNTPKANVTPTERPRRELRKRLRSEPEEDIANEEELPEEMEDKEEVSNVKLKVKVGYTATGAMIRPPLNGGRKKKRRFRNMHVKKSSTKTISKASTPPAKRSSPSTPTTAVKDEKKDLTPRTRQAMKKGKAAEPIAGPSGLQKVKRSPRRVLKRKAGTSTGGGEVEGDESEEDDEDLDYVCSLYPNQSESNIEVEPDTSNQEIQEEATDPLKLDEEEPKTTNGDSKELSHHIYSTPSVNGVIAVTQPEVEDMVSIEEVQCEDVDAGEDHVVVIGDTVDVHNYAKPHSL